MSRIHLYLVQLYSCTERGYENNRASSNRNTHVTCQENRTHIRISADRRGTARVAYRTVPALRQTWLQVCHGAWTWAEAVSIHKSPQEPAGNDLRARALEQTGGCVHQKLCERACGPRRNRCDQRRIDSSPGGVLNYVKHGGHRYWALGGSLCHLVGGVLEKRACGKGAEQ